MPLRKESLKVSKTLVLSRSGMLPIVAKILPINPFAADREANLPHPLPDLTKTGQSVPRPGDGFTRIFS
jgi:hypothetical protein